MKKTFVFLLFILSSFSVVLAQKKGLDDDGISKRMTQYIRNQLRMTDAEGEKFTPVFTILKRDNEIFQIPESFTIE